MEKNGVVEVGNGVVEVKKVRLTKAQRQQNTIQVAKNLDRIRAVCAELHAEFKKNPHVRIGPLLTDRGLDMLTFDAVCYAAVAAGAEIWPSRIDRS